MWEKRQIKNNGCKYSLCFFKRSTENNKGGIKLTQSEYIVWKCETIGQIKEKHPAWSESMVKAYFNKIEEELKKRNFFD